MAEIPLKTTQADRDKLRWTVEHLDILNYERPLILNVLDDIATLTAALSSERDKLADLQGRLWCALGQPLNIEYVQAVKNLVTENAILRAQESAHD